MMLCNAVAARKEKTKNSCALTRDMMNRLPTMMPYPQIQYPYERANSIHTWGQ